MNMLIDVSDCDPKLSEILGADGLCEVMSTKSHETPQARCEDVYFVGVVEQETISAAHGRSLTGYNFSPLTTYASPSGCDSQNCTIKKNRG